MYTGYISLALFKFKISLFLYSNNRRGSKVQREIEVLVSFFLNKQAKFAHVLIDYNPG